MPRKDYATIERIVTWVAATVAVILAIALPAIYMATAYNSKISALRNHIDLTANVVSERIAFYPDLWKFDQHRIEEKIGQLRQHHSDLTRYRVLDMDGEVVIDLGDSLDWPTMTLAEELSDGIETVGRLELTSGLQPMMMRGIIAALLGIGLGLITFVTVRVLPLRALIAANSDIVAARDEATAANRSKSEFLANMSHELRTPLNAIIGFSEMIRGETFGPVGSPKYLEYVTDINKSGEHLLALINDILDLSKIEAGEVDIDNQTVDFFSVIEACLLLVKERAASAELTLTTEVSAGFPLLYADERRIKQILINLLANSIKFTPAGGTVTIKAWFNQKDGFVFQVVDDGIGIAPEHIHLALGNFKQVDSDLNRKYQGTGLGLPLVKSLAELHGGTFELQSQVDVGTTATVRFPAYRIALQAATGT